MKEKVVIPLALTFYVCIEFVWITTMKAFYSSHFKRVQLKWSGQYKIVPAILCYAIILAIIYFFLIKNKKAKIIDAIFLALAMYGVYNLTNKATFDNYSWQVVFIDTTWGLVSMTFVLLATRFLRTL